MSVPSTLPFANSTAVPVSEAQRCVHTETNASYKFVSVLACNGVDRKAAHLKTRLGCFVSVPRGETYGVVIYGKGLTHLALLHGDGLQCGSSDRNNRL